MRNISLIKDQKTREILAEVEKRVKKIFGDKLKKVILFGSYARNEQDEESDIDIMTLVDLNMGELSCYQSAIIDAVFDLELEHNVLISVAKASYYNFNRYADVLPFYMNIRNEGIEIYG